MDLDKLEHDIKDQKQMKKILEKHFKELVSVDDFANFICELRARAWYWQEEDHANPEMAKFYSKIWQSLFAKASQYLTVSEYMDFYYAVDPNP